MTDFNERPLQELVLSYFDESEVDALPPLIQGLLAAALNHEGEAKVPTACKRCDSTCCCPCHGEN